MTGKEAPWEWLWEVWKHLGLLPNQCGNPKLTRGDAGFLWIFIRRTAGVARDSPDVHEQYEYARRMMHRLLFIVNK